MKRFAEQKDRAAIFTTFLNVKGRMLFDAIVVKPKLAGQEEEPEYWIDVHEDDSEDLIRHMKRYALRNKNLHITDISDIIKVHQL